MLSVLIVEDNAIVAKAIKAMFDKNPGSFEASGIADDYLSAMELATKLHPDIALVDLQLARHSTGYAVAAALSKLDIGCIFITGQVPPFPVPEFAIGCISKPCTITALSIALATAVPLPKKSTLIASAPMNSHFELY